MSYSIEPSTYPTTMLLTMTNVTTWEHQIKNKLTAFPDIGQAIRTKTPYVLAKPTIDDLIEDTNIRMYNLQPDNPTSLTESSLNNFEKRDQRRREEEAKVCHLILSSLSEEAQMHLRSVGAFTKAIDDNDSYAMFTIAKDEHSRSSSFAVALHIFQQLMTIKKDGSFSKLIQDLTDHRLTFSAVFDPNATGSVPIDHIWVMILMNALPDSEFMFMKESMYAKDLKVAFPQFAVVLQEMQNYDLNKKKATPKQEATVPAGPTILSASSPNPAQTKCTTCSEMFNTTMRKVGTGIYTICFKCSTKARKAREAAAAHPTPAQVAGPKLPSRKRKPSSSQRVSLTNQLLTQPSPHQLSVTSIQLAITSNPLTTR